MLTPTDAKHEPTVRKALEAALVSGVARPAIWFGPFMWAVLEPRGVWAVWALGADVPATDLTTDDAVALIVSTARGI